MSQRAFFDNLIAYDTDIAWRTGNTSDGDMLLEKWQVLADYILGIDWLI